MLIFYVIVDFCIIIIIITFHVITLSQNYDLVSLWKLTFIAWAPAFFKTVPQVWNNIGVSKRISDFWVKYSLKNAVHVGSSLGFGKQPSSLPH